MLEFSSLCLQTDLRPNSRIRPNFFVSRPRGPARGHCRPPCGQSGPKASENQGVTPPGRTRLTGLAAGRGDTCGRWRLTPTRQPRENEGNPNEVKPIAAEPAQGSASLAAQPLRPTPDTPRTERRVEVSWNQRRRMIAWARFTPGSPHTPVVRRAGSRRTQRCGRPDAPASPVE